MNSDYFIISSFDPLPRHYLHGLCFQGEDLITGNAGYEKYRAARKADIHPGQDGSYVVLNSYETETVIGTDFSGYHKLFLYQQKEEWILSNSLIETARLAARRGLPVTVDETHLSTFFIEGSFGNQLTSLRTSVKEIRLVPATREVVISRSLSRKEVALRPTAAITNMEQQSESYADAMRDYLRLWVGRMATILQSDLYVRSDLTGGQDSRAVLAILLAASQKVGKDYLQNIRFTSDKGAREDFAVARQIAEKFHLRLMDHRSDPRAPVLSDLSSAYEKWKVLCLGVYAPIYFPIRRPAPSAAALGGSGGESHRKFYSGSNLECFINSRQKFIPSTMHFSRLKQDILEDITFLRQGRESSADPMLVHYRHFRDRCHGGRAPQYANLISPLAGATLRRASSLCSQEQFDRRQVLADVLINTCRELAFMPYDHPKKSFGSEHLASLLDASDAISSAFTGGRVFAAEPSSQIAGDFTTRAALKMLQDEFLEHYEPMRKTGFFPVKYLEKARTTLADATRNGRFSHAVDGCPVSHVILAGELSRLSGRVWQQPSFRERLGRLLSRPVP